MPNRYANLTGTNKIKDEWSKINAGFDKVEQELDAHLTDTSPHKTIRGIDKLGLSSAGNTGDVLTIANGAITVTRSYHAVDTEGAASTDDLTTINGGNVGDILILRQYDSLRDITIKGNGSGNIFTFDRSDLILDSASSAVILVKSELSGYWVVVGVQGVKRSGDTMTGDLNVRKPGAASSLNSTATGNPLYELMLDSVRRGLLFHDRPSGNLHLQKYAADGVTLETRIILQSDRISLAGTEIFRRSDSPEGNQAASVGSLCVVWASSAGLWVKASGTGNTGWRQVAYV